eukprot:1210640-Pyramimonas_sp.AAC.1
MAETKTCSGHFVVGAIAQSAETATDIISDMVSQRCGRSLKPLEVYQSGSLKQRLGVRGARWAAVYHIRDDL